MLIVYLALFLLSLWGCQFSGKGFREEAFSRSVTNSVKGIFIWLVFLSHFAGYVSYSSLLDRLGQRISLWLGHLIVACFLFYSGYGVCEAIKTHGDAYLKDFPKKRILKTLLHFDLAVLLFIMIQLFQGESISLSSVLLALIGWKSFGNSNWYIFVVIALYLLTWTAFSLVKDHRKAAALQTLLSLVLVVFLYHTKASWWYDTILCYVLGMWVSLYYDTLLRIVTKNHFLWGSVTLGMTAIVLFAHILQRFPLWETAGLLCAPPAFCLLITLLLFKFRVSNPILQWCGRYTFELYILQRIPMILLKEWGMAEYNIYIYFLSCVAVTVALSAAFRYCTDKLDKILFVRCTAP